jgi:hypothetical protein
MSCVAYHSGARSSTRPATGRRKKGSKQESKARTHDRGNGRQPPKRTRRGGSAVKTTVDKKRTTATAKAAAEKRSKRAGKAAAKA